LGLKKGEGGKTCIHISSQQVFQSMFRKRRMCMIVKDVQKLLCKEQNLEFKTNSDPIKV